MKIETHFTGEDLEDMKVNIKLGSDEYEGILKKVEKEKSRRIEEWTKKIGK